MCISIHTYLYARVFTCILYVKLCETEDLLDGVDTVRALVLRVCCSVLQFVAVCCSVLQCVAVCRNMLQCVAVIPVRIYTCI